MSELYRFVHAEKACYPVLLLCEAVKVARLSCYAWCESEAARRATDETLAHELRAGRSHGLPADPRPA